MLQKKQTKNRVLLVLNQCLNNRKKVDCTINSFYGVYFVNLLVMRKFIILTGRLSVCFCESDNIVK